MTILKYTGKIDKENENIENRTQLYKIYDQLKDKYKEKINLFEGINPVYNTNSINYDETKELLFCLESDTFYPTFTNILSGNNHHFDVPKGMKIKQIVNRIRRNYDINFIINIIDRKEHSVDKFLDMNIEDFVKIFNSKIYIK